MHSRHEPPDNQLPSVLAAPELVWRSRGGVLAIPALMIYTTGVYLLILYRTAHRQARTFEHARAVADRLGELRAGGRAVTLLGGEHRDFGFTYRAWVPFSVNDPDAAAWDSLTFELRWTGVAEMTRHVEGSQEHAAKAVTLW